MQYSVANALQQQRRYRALRGGVGIIFAAFAVASGITTFGGALIRRLHDGQIFRLLGLVGSHHPPDDLHIDRRVLRKIQLQDLP